MSGRESRNGKKYITLSREAAAAYQPERILLNCGRCDGCLLDRSREWAVRCVHEASLYEDNCFITLTYDDVKCKETAEKIINTFMSKVKMALDKNYIKEPIFDLKEFIPINRDYTLVKSDFQKFMKRLRKAFPDRKIRYFHCGEYGELGRPHHHAALFNIDFSDKKLVKYRENVCLYGSKILENIWSLGNVYVGSVNFESAGYIARYVLKKRHNDKELISQGKIPEYLTMSRDGGIGKNWIEKYSRDVYPHDYFIIRKNVKCKPPRFYDSVYEKKNKEVLCQIKEKRLVAAKCDENRTEKRLYDRGKVKMAQISSLRREL